MIALETFRPTGQFRLLYAARHVFEDQVVAPESSGQYPRYHQEILTLLQEFDIQLDATDTVRGIAEKIPSVDYVFSLMNRINIVNGEVYVSSLCEYYGTAYLGARPSVRAIAEDKSTAKHLATSLGIPTPYWVVVGDHLPASAHQPFPGPFFVKPRFGAASEYITYNSYQENWKDAVHQAKLLLSMGQEVIIEQFFPGLNITIPILGGREPIILPAVVLNSENYLGILTYKNKLQVAGVMPFSLFTHLSRLNGLTEAASIIFDAIKPVDYARFDFRYNPKSNSFGFLEMNICCDISSFGSLMFAANALDLTQRQIISHVLAYSNRRQRGRR